MIEMTVEFCSQVQQARRADMRRDAEAWRLLHQGRPTQPNRATYSRLSAPAPASIRESQIESG